MAQLSVPIAQLKEHPLGFLKTDEFLQMVETYERMDAEIKNVVVGKVVSIVRHENSDHMWDY